jgi:hypothetical protein
MSTEFDCAGGQMCGILFLIKTGSFHEVGMIVDSSHGVVRRFNLMGKHSICNGRKAFTAANIQHIDGALCLKQFYEMLHCDCVHNC